MTQQPRPRAETPTPDSAPSLASVPTSDPAPPPRRAVPPFRPAPASKPIPLHLALALALSAAAALLVAIEARAQDSLVPPYIRPPDQIGGPPRSLGDIPEGYNLPPSSLPGRFPGQPPRALGETGFPASSPLNRPPARVDLPGGASNLPPGGPSGLETRFQQGGREIPIPSLPRADVPPVLRRDLPLTLDQLPALPENLGNDLTTAPPRPPRPRGVPLTLEEVLVSTFDTHPGLLATLGERGVADGLRLAAAGAFDTVINSDARNYPLGYYRRGVYDFFIDQPLVDLGGKFFTGYRVGPGRFPVYYQYLDTRDGGAWVTGFEVPLLQNRAIDPKRAKFIQTEIERAKVEPTIQKRRLELFKLAAKAYWDWVAAGLIEQVADDLLAIIAFRREGLERLLREGLARPIDIVDFGKIETLRRKQAIEAKLRYRRAALELSLYLRDPRGIPVVPDASRLPLDVPPPIRPETRWLEDDLDIALRLRPEILSLRLQGDKIAVDRELARNQILPSLNLYVYTEQGIGGQKDELGSDRRQFQMEASLLFDVPIQRRAARGALRAAEASLGQIAQLTRLAADQIRNDVLEARAQWDAAHLGWEQAREAQIIARRLQLAEAILLREGGSNLLILNLREQFERDAIIERIEAQAKSHAAEALYFAALGLAEDEPFRIGVGAASADILPIDPLDPLRGDNPDTNTNTNLAPSDMPEPPNPTPPNPNPDPAPPDPAAPDPDNPDDAAAPPSR